jgi:hypothetical protein
VLLCANSTAGLQPVRLGAFERYCGILSGAFIALVGIAFWVWLVLVAFAPMIKAIRAHTERRP